MTDLKKINNKVFKKNNIVHRSESDWSTILQFEEETQF